MEASQAVCGIKGDAGSCFKSLSLIHYGKILHKAWLRLSISEDLVLCLLCML